MSKVFLPFVITFPDFWYFSGKDTTFFRENKSLGLFFTKMFILS